MACDVKIIEDSINPFNGVRLTTFQLRYWRSIHGEVMTHRVFSRNASSSRAIPIKTFLKQVWNDPAGPIHWGKNQAGMKAREELTGFKKWFVQKTWSFTGKVVCSFVWLANVIAKPHKQTLNRLLEPWQYISVVLTATDFDNWFELRDHPDAQPEIQELARRMKEEMDKSMPVTNEYHLPYVTEQERRTYKKLDLFKLSTARCARVSYLTHDGNTPSYLKDVKLYNDLVGSTPIHASPTEHCATASVKDSTTYIKNFRGWVQHRVEVEEFIKLNKVEKK
jgi:hypothetical protein